MVASTTSEELGPWHDGELRMQQSAGVVEKMDAVGRRTIRDHLIEQHRLFFPQLPFVVLGAVDGLGDVWATVRAGPPGFLAAPDPKHLDVTIARDFSDPAERGMDDGAGIGLLGIELHTRRRNRLNGVIRRDRPGRFRVTVEQSYGNCPQYIQIRDLAFVQEPGASGGAEPTRIKRLEGSTADLVRNADTFFVASYVNDEGQQHVDVSHRGGRSGFVRLDDDGGLTIPDFAGNLFFNTLGNFVLNPKAGLAFVDFNSGDLLQMTGDAEVILDAPDIAAFQGAERLWRFHPRQIIVRAGALPLRWNFSGGWSPNSLLAGDWQRAAIRLQAAEKANEWRIFRVARVVDESRIVRSLCLEPTDGAGIVVHRPGQHLPIRVTVDGEPKPLLRTYTLSLAPSDEAYRISVKREGRVSRILHELKVGDAIEVRAPAGSFTIDAAEPRPAVLLAAGIGITPMLAMLRHIVYEGARTRYTRRTWLFYSARSKDDRAFDIELSKLVEAAGGAVRLIRFLSDPQGAETGDFDVIGRVDATAIALIVPLDECDFFLCGPGAFMQSVYDGLLDLNVADERIHAEAFGTVGLHRSRSRQIPREQRLTAAKRPVSVAFAKSGTNAIWKPGSGSLLELAEAAGLQPEFQCRMGSCGTCRTRLLKGAVVYETQPAADVDDAHALICCALPADSALALEL
jgi:ferredoxin-NADP reductase/predicted pyridoxine 5'-phosphate oxidase superfamily flavin-nucleotide-binding protein